MSVTVSSNVEEKISLLTLHKHPEFKEQCMTILNKQWPRSETLRYRSLDCSCDQFPTSLVLVNSTSEKTTLVLGHSRLNCIPNEQETVWIESVVIHDEYRGKGYGTVLMQKTEEYAASLGFKIATLSTHGEEKFYEKLGYEFSYPVSVYGGTVNRLFLPNTFVPLNRTIYRNERIKDVVIDTKINNIYSSSSSNLVPLINNNNSNIPSPPPLPPLLPQVKNTKLKTSDIQRINDKNLKTYMRKKIAV